jgi:hypothetical protein
MRKIALLLASLSLLACGRRAPAPPPPPPVEAELLRLPLPARLAREAQGRPPGTPRVEEVMAALGGLGLERVQQVLASPLGAAFCASAATARGTVVAVCEFASEGRAQGGMSYSHRAFDAIIPGRTLVLNRKTLLTVSGAPADAQAALTAFARL